MKKNSGYTYVEMLVSLVVASILVMGIGTVSSISNNSYKKVLNEAAIFGDISFGCKLMQNRVRSADSLVIQDNSGSTVWVGESLLINNSQMFGLYQDAVSNTIDFVYVDDISNINDREVIFSIPSAGNASLDFSTTGRTIGIIFTGEKNKIPFDLRTKITRRG